MAYNSPTGFICFNNSDLITDGYIYPFLTEEHDPKNFNMVRLSSPEKGVRYTVIRDASSGEIIKIQERRKQLPASKLKLEIIFGKVLKNALTSVIDPVFLTSFGGIGGGSIFWAGASLLPINVGGITSGTTELTYSICDAETKINYRVLVDKKIKDTGIVTFDWYVLSVLGVVKEVSKGDEFIALNLSQDQIEKIGKFSSGVYEGVGKRLISGATDTDGLFGGKGIPYVNIDEILEEGQEQLFIEIIFDERQIKYRGDNPNVSGKKSYPFSSNNLNDASSKSIRIKTDNIKEGDILCITMSVSTKRHRRQTIRHLGKIFQDTSYGVSSKMAEIGSELDIHEYSIKEWVGNNLTYKESIKDEYYKLYSDGYVSFKSKGITNFHVKYNGWRMNSVLSNHIDYFWAADYRGILLCYKTSNSIISSIVVSYSEMKEKEWFKNYIDNFSGLVDKIKNNKGETIPSKYYKFEEKISPDDIKECFFDISEPSNCILFDTQKIPYYSVFAKYLSSIEFPQILNFPLLDLCANLVATSQGLQFWMSTARDQIALDSFVSKMKGYFPSYTNKIQYVDFSLIEFDNLCKTPLKLNPCESGYDVDISNYSCHTYDVSDGPGVYFSRDYIENQFLEWRPSGGYSNSYWKFETPYFGGEYNQKTRIYIEKVGGNCLNTYSWVYVDTLSSISDNISADRNDFTHETTLAFNDNTVNNALSYHLIADSGFDEGFSFTSLDWRKNHNRDPFDYNLDKYIGYDKILGTYPSFSSGISIMDEVIHINDKTINDVYCIEIDLLEDKFKLDFNSDNPTITIPSSQFGDRWGLKSMTLSYNLKDPNSSIPENLKSFALYFKDNNSVINNKFLPITYDKYEKGYMFGCGNYSSQNISFIGDIFKYLDIKQVRGIFIDGNIDQFKINSSRFSVVYDNNGKTVIFYEDEDSNNISVAFSFDNGASWVRNKDIIRLTKNETASSPLAVLDQNTGYVNLFYCLNGVFLMLSIIDPKLFSLQDVFVEYFPPLTYDEYTTDNNNIESSSLFKYSENGKLLRKTSSYFVYGNQSDPYFQEQLKIYNSLRDKELFSAIPPRFIFSSDNSFLNSEFTDFSYSFCIDKSGVKRLFIVKEGKLTILSSGDFISWSIDIEGKEFHKDYLLDSENKGKTYEIKNLQVIKNYYDDDNLGLLYFYNSMMFVRFLDAKELKNKANLDKYLSISKGNLSNPLFLVGKLDEDLKRRKIIEIQNNTLYQDSDVPIFFPDNYLNEEILNSFDEDFDVDVDTQPYGVTSKNGIIRVFYKDSNFILNSLSIKGWSVFPETLMGNIGNK